MTDAEGAVDDARTFVEWRRASPDGVATPIVRRLPYLELKLEHPDLEPSGHVGRFFPDAVPYALDGTPRLFVWRPILASAAEPNDWVLACATTHELVGFDSLPAAGPSLVADEASGTVLVVDGAISGETTTNRVASYSTPTLSIDGRSDAAVGLTVDGTAYRVSAGERRRIRLAERCVDPTNEAGGSTTIRPELVVRYPGRRELHHPAPGATYRLFPSFGLDIDEMLDPLPIPTVADELDETALATELGVDLSKRPYPERVLWQAFAYTAFDPRSDSTPELTQLRTGHIVLRTEGEVVGEGE